MTKGFFAGFSYAYLWRTDTSYHCLGQQNTLSNGADSAAYRLPDVKTAGLQYQAPNNIQFQGGDKIVDFMQFGNQKLNAFEISSSSFDSALMALVSGSTVNTTSSEYTIYSDNSNLTFPAQFGVALVQRYQGRGGSDGGSQFHTLVLPCCDVRIKQGGFSFQGESDNTLSVTPHMVTAAPSGESFGSTGLNMNLEDDTADHYDIISRYPTFMHAFRQNAVATTFTLPYRPVSSTVTINATPNYFTVGGTITALSSVNTTTGLVTLAAAGTTAVLDYLLYQTRFVPV